ncbi:ASCH domain-containing protein [Rahnella woolbedingensis]|uniref:ASCH domain-containing protein n=2 Tax=Rahnella woolbedingensis TaxID=1510574 RepID=A0A419N1L4_9GAMM|nr:ASCH domain-containing protein [Rahnella woolbedingensis]
MKALSIVRPAGTQIANGLKTLEIRRWQPDVRTGEEILLVENEHFLTVDGQEEVGTAIAIITLGEIREFRQEDIPKACASYYEAGWLAWEIKTIKKIENPFPTRAARKFYEIDDLVLNAARLIIIR